MNNELERLESLLSQTPVGYADLEAIQKMLAARQKVLDLESALKEAEKDLAECQAIVEEVQSRLTKGQSVIFVTSTKVITVSEGRPISVETPAR